MEGVVPGQAAEQAGLRAGDRIVASLFDLAEVETEQPSRGASTLSGTREGRQQTWLVPVGAWGLAARPVLPDTIAALNDAGHLAWQSGDAAAAATAWRHAAALAMAKKQPALAAALSWKAGTRLAEARQWSLADDAYADALSTLDGIRAPLPAAAMARDWCASFQGRDDWRGARSCYQRALAASKAGSLTAAACHNGLALAARTSGDLSSAEAGHRRALEIQEKLAPESLAVARTLRDLGDALEARQDHAAAEAAYHRAVTLGERLAPGSVELASSLKGLGAVRIRRGDPAGGEEDLLRALAILERLRPDTEEVASALETLASSARARSDRVAQEERHRRSLAIRERLAPDSLAVAASLHGLGVAMLDRGEMAASEDFFRRALAIHQARAPGTLRVAALLNNLGLIAMDRGDLVGAEALHREALTIKEVHAPESLSIAASLTNLGGIALWRGDLDSAEDYFRRTSGITEKAAPDTFDEARALCNLGRVARAKHELSVAEGYERRALEVRRKIAPDGLQVSYSLSNLADLARDRGDLATAERMHREVLAIREKLAPGGVDMAYTLHSLGELATSRSDPASAADLYQRALAIWQRLAPGSLSEAETLNALGAVQVTAGHPEAAPRYYCSAVDALESQKMKLGGTEEARLGFGAKYGRYYQDCLLALLRSGRPEQAFHVLERSRARLLLTLLAERDLLFRDDLPVELARQRQSVDTEYERTQSTLAGLKPSKDDPEIDRLLAQLRELREERAAVAARIRKDSPRFAALQYPEPLDLAGARQVLDPGEALLAYSVGADETVLFVVRGGERSGRAPAVSVFRLGIGEAALRARVKAFRSLIERRESRDDAALQKRGRELYDLLVRPAEGSIAGALRLVLCPDGPLHGLPFAALIRRPTRTRGGPAGQYLVQWKPVHFVVSATVYGELKKGRRAPADSSPVRLTAFGDPRYPPVGKDQPLASAEVREALRRGADFPPLPGTRREVDAIAELYAPAATKYLGDEATEERAKTIGKDVRYVHFACHAVADERFPLDSALALSIRDSPTAGQENGLLQAWEIFDRVRIDADLVTLSACRTGLGAEMAGEGLISLTRAFQYAGARSVLGSLWNVADESTPELMESFYRGLKEGRPKDEALRAAQLEILTGRFAQPFYWAGFQVNGEWR